MKKKLSITLLICLITIAQAWFIYITFSYPYAGAFLDKNEADQWVIESFDSIGIDLGLEVDDIILEVDHFNADQHFTIQKFRSLEHFQHAVVLRNGKIIEITTENSAALSVFEVVILLTSIPCLLFVYLLNVYMPQSKSAIYLSVVHFHFFIAFSSVGASNRGDILAKIIVYTLVASAPIFFLHFLYELLKEKGDITKSTQVFKYFYLSIIFFVFIQLLYFTNLPQLFNFHTLNRNIVMCLFLIGIILNFIFLTYTYFKYKKSYSSTIIKVISISLLVSFGPVCLFSFIPELLTGQLWIDTKYTLWFIMFLPFSFTYLIISNQVYDLNIITRRVMFIICYSFLPSIVILTIYIFLIKPGISFKQLIVTLLTTSLILFITLSSTRYMVNRFEKWIHPKRHTLKKSLNQIVEKLGTITNFHEFRSIILPEIIQLYKVHGAAIILIYKNNYESISEGKIDVKEVKNLLESPKDLEEHLFYTSYEINRHTEYTSYLVLTKKINNTVLGLEEKQWLILICSYLKICLENIYYLRKLRFELQEKERFRIATDLHDSTMQDLFYLKRRLGAVKHNESVNEEEKKEIANLLDYIDIINLSLRQGCFELYPYTIQDMGLNQAIHKLIDQLHLTHDLEINFKEINEIENYSMDEKRQLFRIIQELVNNTIKHAQATKVNVTTKIIEGMLHLIYEDDGVGFDVKHRSKYSSERSESGLGQIRYRVIDLNGKLKIKSNVSKGVQIHMMFPMEEEQKWGLSS
ncbi:sensor histidine kinase [Chengkuizengella marina]|uniref:histidine kinase n=1 Tax=Chengkuizengella marina TaxID=2507566 RepID=A0A6N9Q6W7_9BACL|nr:ATP-binding protein [Chengkuizengella marina]NBI30645.1 hypothetical protein [Chengkuizengella marina]